MNEVLKMEESDSQKYCLRWNNFQSNFMSQFEALKEDEDFVDVTLSCHGQSIKAHKVVLSACSSYLKNIFKEHPCKHPVIILDSLSFNNLEAVIQFVYTGQVYVEQEELSSFLKAAEILQIRGLTESSSQNLIETTSPEIQENVPVARKREHEDEYEMKKCSNKKVSRRVSGCFTKETEEVKSKEKDWSSNNDNKVKKNIENTTENFCYNTMSELEQSFESEEKGTTGSLGDEEYSGEQKKPHWLDPRSCPMCNRVYSNLSNLRQHMKLIHNPTLVTCKICYKTFKTDLYLRRHLISFHEVNLNGNNGVSIEVYKPVQNHPPTWNQNVKAEPDPFNEIFNSSEMYQVPE